MNLDKLQSLDHIGGMAEPYFKGKLGPGTREKSFKTREDLAVFLREWVANWGWSQGAGQAYQAALQIANQAVSHLSNPQVQPPYEQNALSGVRTLFNQWESGAPGQAMGPEDPRSKLAAELFKTKGQTAANAALSVFLGMPFPLQNPIQPGYLFGLWKAFAFAEGIDDPTPYQQKILTNFLNDEKDRFDKENTNVAEMAAASATIVEEGKANLKVLSERAQVQRETFERLISTSTEELAKLKKSLEEDLALRAPVKYWNDKADLHRKLARSFTGWVALASTVVALVVGGTLGGLALLTGTKEPPWWELGSMAVLTGLLLYLLRILVRVQLSHLHLSTDAEQRAIMVQTYLSLEHHQEIMTKEDRHLILEALFRPVSAGLVKDDQSSLSLIEYIMSRKSG